MDSFVCMKCRCIVEWGSMQVLNSLQKHCIASRLCRDCIDPDVDIDLSRKKSL